MPKRVPSAAQVVRLWVPLVRSTSNTSADIHTYCGLVRADSAEGKSNMTEEEVLAQVCTLKHVTEFLSLINLQDEDDDAGRL